MTPDVSSHMLVHPFPIEDRGEPMSCGLLLGYHESNIVAVVEKPRCCLPKASPCAAVGPHAKNTLGGSEDSIVNLEWSVAILDL